VIFYLSSSAFICVYLIDVAPEASELIELFDFRRVTKQRINNF